MEEGAIPNIPVSALAAEELPSSTQERPEWSGNQTAVLQAFP